MMRGPCGCEVQICENNCQTLWDTLEEDAWKETWEMISERQQWGGSQRKIKSIFQNKNLRSEIKRNNSHVIWKEDAKWKIFKTNQSGRNIRRKSKYEIEINFQNKEGDIRGRKCKIIFLFLLFYLWHLFQGSLHLPLHSSWPLFP